MAANTPLRWTDSAGRAWSTYCDVPCVVRLKAAGYDVKDHERLASILSDPYEAADFVVEFHRPAWESLGLSEVEFLAVMTETEGRLGEAIDAVVAGLIDFFHRFRDALRAGVLRKALAASETGLAEVMARLNSPRADQAIAAELERRLADVDDELERLISGETSGNSSESSESRPMVLPFDRSPRR